MSLVWRREIHNPNVQALVAFAATLPESRSAAEYLSRD